MGLERAGLDTTHVYKTTMNYLLDDGKMRFSERRNVDIYTLKSDLAELGTLLNAKTSTVGGYRKYERQVRKTLKEEYGIDSGEFDDFIAFMSSESGNRSLHQVSSEFLVEFFDTASDEGVSIEQVKDALR